MVIVMLLSHYWIQCLHGKNLILISFFIDIERNYSCLYVFIWSWIVSYFLVARWLHNLTFFCKWLHNITFIGHLMYILYTVARKMCMLCRFSRWCIVTIFVNNVSRCYCWFFFYLLSLIYWEKSTPTCFWTVAGYLPALPKGTAVMLLQLNNIQEECTLISMEFF